MVRNAKTLLRSEHKGSTAIETTILLPLMFGTFILLLYALFMMLAYVAYSNIASNIAHQMNMRQSGYREAVAYYSTLPSIYSYGIKDTPDHMYAYTVSGLYLTNNDISIQVNGYDASSNPYLRSGLYFALCASSMDPDSSLDRKMPDGSRVRGSHVADQFIIPYVQVDHITVNSDKPLDFGSLTGTRAAANSIITVSIDFHLINPLSVFNQHGNPRYVMPAQRNSLIKITAKGYDVIA